MKVSVTKHQKEFIESRVRSGQYQDASDVMREALRLMENLELGRDWLEEQIEEGINSGPAVPVTKEHWKKLRQELREEKAKRRQKPHETNRTSQSAVRFKKTLEIH